MTTPHPIAQAVAAAGRPGWPTFHEAAEVPAGYLPIDFRTHRAVLALDPASAVVWVQAGATFAAIEAAAAAHGLTLGPVPAWLADRPLVESLAVDDRLRPSPRFGQLTDHLLSLRAVLPDGGLSHAPATPRRATGPDLPRCVLGAHHRAGLVVDARLQLWPKPVVVGRRLVGTRFAEVLAAAVAWLRVGVRPVRWQATREGAQVVLHAQVVEAELARLPGGAGEPAPEALSEPRDLQAVFAGSRAEAAAFAEGCAGALIADIRPEGATVFAPTGSTAAVAADPWPTWALTLFDRLGTP